jgi:hypothetical protein
MARLRDDAVFRAIAETIVPEAAQLSAADWIAANAVIDHALAQRPPALVHQLSSFITLIDLFSILRFGRRFSKLSPPRRYQLLHAIEQSRVAVLRKGMWGLRTLMFMGFYARPSAADAIGYRAHAEGWSRLKRAGT